MDGKLVDLIISIIQDRLIDHNAAILPDFGVLFIREQGAEFDLTDEQMLPPQQLIEFLHSTDVQDYSVSYNLSERHEFDIDQSISALDDFVTHVYSSLNSEKRFEFGSLGVFNMSDAGEINFEQSDALPMGLNFGFKPISAVPVKRLELEHKETTIIEGPEPTAAKSGSRRAIMWSAAAILLVIVSATLLIQILGGDNPANPKFTSTALDHDRLNADPTQMEQINDVYTFDELRNGKNEEKIVVDDSTSVDLEQSEASGLTDDEQDSDNTEVVEEIVDVEAPVTIDDDEKNDVDLEKPATTTIVDNRKALGSYTKVPDQFTYPIESNCIIVLGAFGKEKNVERLVARIEAMGFTPYTDILRGLIRVGAQSPCGSDQMNTNTSLLKQRIEATAYTINL